MIEINIKRKKRVRVLAALVVVTTGLASRSDRVQRMINRAPASAFSRVYVHAAAHPAASPAPAAKLALRSPAESTADFKFPVLLCDFQYSMVDEEGGYLQLVHRHSGEQVVRLQTLTPSIGEAKGEYQVPRSSFRFTYKAHVDQGTFMANKLELQAFLEKRDPATGELTFVGQKSSSGTQGDGADGSVLRKVAARSLNTELASFKSVAGKFDRDRIDEGIRSHKLERGTVFRAGPVCLLADVGTVRQITTRGSELADVFKRFDERKAAQARLAAEQARLASANAKPAEPTPTATPTPTAPDAMASDATAIAGNSGAGNPLPANAAPQPAAPAAPPDQPRADAANEFLPPPPMSLPSAAPAPGTDQAPPAQPPVQQAPAPAPIPPTAPMEAPTMAAPMQAPAPAATSAPPMGEPTTGAPQAPGAPGGTEEFPPPPVQPATPMTADHQPMTSGGTTSF